MQEGLEDRLAGVLLGTAIGDAMGLPVEGMRATTIGRRFGKVERFHFLFRTGYVSDDTEQFALVAQSLARGRREPSAIRRQFRRALLGWALRLPWGIGFGTLRACMLLALGVEASGRRSAGNGAAMRAAIIGGALHDEPELRREVGTAIAEVTHTDPRAVAGALFVADLAASALWRADRDPWRCVALATGAVVDPELAARLARAHELAVRGVDYSEAAREIGTSGFVLESVPWAAFCLLRGSGDLVASLSACIGAGGDADSNGAILGAWRGALHGASAIPAHLVGALHDGPFGPSHLRQLARALATGGEAPRYSWPLAMLRNLALYPVVLAHGLRRLVPL